MEVGRCGLYLSHGDAAVHPLRNDLLVGQYADGPLQPNGSAHIECPQQRDEEALEELGGEQSKAEADSIYLS